MTLQVTLGLNTETLTALNELTAAIRGLSSGTSAPAATSTKTSTTAPKDEGGDGPIYWGNNAKGTFGEVATQAAYDALKKKDAKLVKLTPAQFKKKTDEKAAAEAAAAAGGGDEEPLTLEQLVEAFSEYLPASGLDDKTKKSRRAQVLQIAARFGAEKASEVPEEHRRLAVNLVQRLSAGQDVDIEDDEFQELEESEDSGI